MLWQLCMTLKTMILAFVLHILGLTLNTLAFIPSSKKRGESELQRWCIYARDCLLDGCEIEPIPPSVLQYPVHLLSGAMLDMLMGAGTGLAPQDQLNLPAAVLITSAQLRRTALERMHSILTGSPSYLPIR